jgi:hypothetical protein
VTDQHVFAQPSGAGTGQAGLIHLRQRKPGFLRPKGDKHEQVNFQYPKGGEFGNNPRYSRGHPNNEVAKSLLREREDNPVPEFL